MVLTTIVALSLQEIVLQAGDNCKGNVGGS